jgi:hypothetical protein
MKSEGQLLCSLGHTTGLCCEIQYLVYKRPGLAERFWYICLVVRAIAGRRHPLYT